MSSDIQIHYKSIQYTEIRRTVGKIVMRVGIAG